MIKKTILGLLLIASTLITVAQQGEAGLYVDSIGQVYVQANKPAYFFIAPDSKPDSRILVPSKDPKSNPMYFDGNGIHYIRTNDAETNKPVSFKIYADGIAPKVTLHFNQGLLMNSGNRFYVDLSSSAVLRAKDNFSGVKGILISIDGSEFEISNLVFFNNEKDYSVKAFAIDNVGNISDTTQFRVITAVNSIVKMNNVYFDINSSILRPESKSELDEFVKVLTEYPEIRIELRAHTDCRGDAMYNQQLSERRAEAIVNYLILKGIANARLSFKGFGDTSPMNECVKGVNCPDDKHQANRRVEFRILPIK
jgi:outer membrane protein OmpA-like peptidoglycan-associated protein